jgi:hypothetical protein
MLSACAPTATTFTNLSGQGILPVSSNNPYMGSNIFLAKEMEESNYLYKFMKEKGAPQAIELNGTSEDTSSLKLYYSAKQEVYTASPQLDPTLRSREWIIRGPYALERTDYHQVSQLAGNSGGVFEIFGRTEVLGGPATAAETRVITPAFIATPTATHHKLKKHAPKAQAPAANTAPATNAATTPSTATNLDQEALAEARKKGTATPAATKAPAAASKPAVATTGPAVTIERTSPLVIPGEKPATTPSHK